MQPRTLAAGVYLIHFFGDKPIPVKQKFVKVN